MDLDSFLVSLYVLTDDWWRQLPKTTPGGHGRKRIAAGQRASVRSSRGSYGTSLNTRQPSLVCIVLAPEQERQPYPHPADEQREQSSRRNEKGEATGVG